MSEKKYQIRIDGIDIIGKTLNKFQTFETDIFNHNIKTQAIGDYEKKIIVVFVQVRISKVNEFDILLAEILIGIGFYIENYEEVINKDANDKYVIPIELENLLKSISISTMRGIMFSEFRGTQLHRAVLPIIFMDSLKPTEGNLFDKAPTV